LGNYKEKRKNIEEENEEEEKNKRYKDSYTDGKKIVEDLKNNLNTVITFTKETKVPRGEDDWYKYCGVVMKKIKKDYPEITEQKLLEFLASHMIEMLIYTDKLEIMKYLYSLERIEKDSFIWYLKSYFERNCIVTKKFHAIILYNLNKRMIFLLNKENIWVQAQPEDEIEIANSKEAKQFLEPIDKNKYNNIIGFIGYEKKNKYLVFKTKNMESLRDTGARCDEAGKSKTLALLKLELNIYGIIPN
jgi:hypothetical protein